MPNICYTDKAFTPSHDLIIEQANEIIREYNAQGFRLTLRQLYYQFVARGMIANKDTEYKRLGGIVSAARLAGRIDWSAIEDRTRFMRSKPSWETPQEMMEACAGTRDSYIWPFSFDMWKNQPHRPEVWIEKDALVGVIEGACHRLDVPFFSCRGYTSQSALWRAGRRLKRYAQAGQAPVIFHLGDHDPSGIDMTRDVVDRVSLFAETDVSVIRLALNMRQVAEFNPPPNPAKLSDSRARSYISEYGADSWELDALDPTTMAAIIHKAVLAVRDDAAWEEMVERRDAARAVMAAVADRWNAVAEFVR